MARRLALTLDLVFALGLALWWAGGVRVGEKLLLAHGAEPRRGALIALCLVLFVPALRAQSYAAGGVLRLMRTLSEHQLLRAALLVSVALIAGAVGVLQMVALRFPVFDVGIFHQLGWAISQGLGFHSTLSGAGDFLKDHLALSLTLLAPLYWVFASSPLILPLTHVALIMGGIWAWVVLAKRESTAQSRLLIALVLILSLGWDSLWANLRWGFHETAIAFFAFSWALTLARGSEREWRLSYVFLFLGCLSKETLLLTGAGAGALWPLLRRAPAVRARTWFFTGAWVVLMLTAFVLFQLKEHAPDKNYFVRYYSYLGDSLSAMLWSLITRPWSVVEAVGGLELLRYFGALLIPFFFAPLFVLFQAKQHRAALVCVLMPLPSIATQALATYAPLRSPGLHYVLEIWPFWMAASILLWSSLWERRPRQVKIWVALAVAVQLFRWVQDPVANVREFAREAREADTFRDQLSALPPQASVAVSDGIGTWVSARKSAIRWPEGARFLDKECPDYFVVAHDTELGVCRPQVRTISEYRGWRLFGFTKH